MLSASAQDEAKYEHAGVHQQVYVRAAPQECHDKQQHSVQPVNVSSNITGRQSDLPHLQSVMVQQGPVQQHQFAAHQQAINQQLLMSPEDVGPHVCHQTAAEQFPQRPGQPVCDFYARTGHCKFAQSCRFDHPPELAVKLSRLGLPLRHAEPICPYYAKTAACKYGPSCKFNHPEPPWSDYEALQ